MAEKYDVKCVTTKIAAVSRVSVKIYDNHYTVEMSEERVVPDGECDIDLEKERAALFDAVNAEVDRQVQDIVASNIKR